MILFASPPSAPAFADANIFRLRSSVPGIQCVAVCDLYDSRHTAAQEAVKNPSVPATRDYRTILDRKDVDSVLIATMDHQHRHIFEDACAAGKDIYCEKPMSHTVEDGFAMMEAAQKNKRMVAVGSQRVSSVLYAKAKEIYDSGKLGEVFSINAYWDRNSPSGAWVYPIPPDASEKTIDWNTFLGNAPKHAVRSGPLLPLALLHRLRRRPRRRSLRSPALRNSVHHRHQRAGAARHLFRRPLPLQRWPRIPRPH